MEGAFKAVDQWAAGSVSSAIKPLSFDAQLFAATTLLIRQVSQQIWNTTKDALAAKLNNTSSFSGQDVSGLINMFGQSLATSIANEAQAASVVKVHALLNL